MLRAICISALGAPGLAVNLKDLCVIPRTTSTHNTLVISHQHVSWFSSTLKCHFLPNFFFSLRQNWRSLSAFTTCVLTESCSLKQIHEQWQPEFAFPVPYLATGIYTAPGELLETGDFLWSCCTFHPRGCSALSNQWSRRHVHPVYPFPFREDRKCLFGLLSANGSMCNQVFSKSSSPSRPTTK